MSEPVLLPVVDTPPKSGVFVDADDMALTPEERDEGNRLGREIDIDDDFDNGLGR
jgi:hypothetical protein